MSKHSLISFTGIISIPGGNSAFFIFPAGIIARLKPCFFASLILCSIRLTRRTSPVNPTSPIKQSFISTAISLKLEATATTTLIIVDVDTGCEVAFKSPIQKQLGKEQDIGAVITYARRYAYNIALNISENDMLDSQDLNKVANNYKMQNQAKNSGLTPKNNERNNILQALNMNADINQIKGWLEQNKIQANKFEDLTDTQLMQVWNMFKGK